MVYAVYRSKYNKESIDFLKYEMSLNDFLEYKEYIDVHEDMENAAHKDQELRMKQNNNR